MRRQNMGFMLIEYAILNLNIQNYQNLLFYYGRDLIYIQSFYNYKLCANGICFLKK